MKKGNTLIVVLLVLLLFTDYRRGLEIRRLRDTVNNNSNYLSRRIENISSDVSNAAREMKKQALWVRDSSIEIKSASDNYDEFEAKLTFTLNERKTGESLYIVASNMDGDSSERVEVAESESMTYEVPIKLEDMNYEFELMGIDDEGSRSEALTSIYLNDIKNRMINIDGMMPRQKFSHDPYVGEIDFYVAVSAVHPKENHGVIGIKPGIDFESIEADVYTGMTKIDTIDLMNGKGYEQKEMDEITKATPEFKGDVETIMFAGTYTFEGEDCRRYLEAMDSAQRPMEEEIFFLVRAIDGKGNEFKGIMPGHAYMLDGDEVKYMWQ